MDNAQLTRKQKEFLDYILEYKEENDIWPTYREIAEAFNYKSPNSVTQNIQALLKKDVLIRTQEDEYDIHPDYDKNFGIRKSTGIPVRGLIAAGYLQEAVEADLGKITLETLFPHLDSMFALRVSGMSMKDAGIYDGDFVLLMDGDIRDGDIGAVLYNGETSLKRIYKDKNGLRLEPANDEYSDIIIEPDIFEEVRVIGKYIGHVNRSGIHKATRMAS
ncbi:MAG: repressor LexA [Balneolaceae bacterium]|nr:MAG: repressor LexA [Balneolaceae bacterium]